jgi:heme peroxidase
MARIMHGEAPSLESLLETIETIRTLSRDSGLPVQLANVRPSWPFGYLFCELQKKSSSLLPTSTKTVSDLRRLGETMIDKIGATLGPNARVPAVYTFFGQFVDHDITFAAMSKDVQCISEACDPTPIPLEKVALKIRNLQTPCLDLATVYEGDAQRKGDNEMRIDQVTESPNGFPDHVSLADPYHEFHDLPREKRASGGKVDRMALIGDTRNDENLIIAQLHVAFLRAHNFLVKDQEHTYESARKFLRQHYQWIVLDDFLYQVADHEIVDKVRDKKPSFFNPPAGAFFMPLEFTVAAYRFGHSKVRPAYDINNLNTGELFRLFIFTLASGSLAGADNLPSDWIINWKGLVFPSKPAHFSRPIDTMLSEPLSGLLQAGGKPMGQETNLAIRNLLRGYILRMPTGQAVAEAMGFTPLDDTEIASVAGSPEQLTALKDGKFLERTPLWFYILAEAAKQKEGECLGEVGSTIVAEVLYRILENSTDSILTDRTWKDPDPGTYKLADLLKLARVL